MKTHSVSELWQKQHGLVTSESYSTAWLGLVPDSANPGVPAWPEALTTLRLSQLSDGGWGDGSVYYPHDRLISTLAALQTLQIWHEPQDAERIERGLAILPRYAQDLSPEWVDPIGFELLLPAIARELEQLGFSIPTEAWTTVSANMQAKLNLIGKLDVNPDQPRTWWFSMEMLPPDRLATFNTAVLDRYGAIATSSATTAAYLRAHRLHGHNVPTAAAYLNHVVQATGGGGNVTWPIDVFELAWTLDNLRRAGLRPNHASLAPMIWRLSTYWELPPLGITWNQAFRVQDGDHPAVAYKVLRWAGLKPSDEPLLKFWKEETGHYMTYLDERVASLSTMIHGLTAFRDDPHNRLHRHIAERMTDWLWERVRSGIGFQDKWHLSPLYTAARLLPTLIGWDDALAQHTLDFILSQQRTDGGWGCTLHANLEETALAALALTEAYGAGLLKGTVELRNAERFLDANGHRPPRERLWIGKSLYLPIGVVQGTIVAAQIALSRVLSEASQPFYSVQTLSRFDARQSMMS